MNRTRYHAFALFSAACFALGSSFAASLPPAGTLSGQVGNSVSGAMLRGAEVEIPALGVSTLTDAAGEFTLRDVPAGEHVVVVRYTGLDALRQSVSVAPGARVVRSFELTSQIYRMQEFKVTGELEGNAASITRQRNAINVTNVVAMDALGSLPNMSMGELASRLPGLAGAVDDGGEVNSLIIRGTPADLNGVTIDGMPTAGSGLGRGFPPNTMNIAMFEEMEVIKGHRPDQSANSLGGTINLKSRSPLALKDKRQFTYNVGARWAPGFTDQIPERREHPTHPLINFTYQEVFDVLGGRRNLGISFSTFYSENVVVYDKTNLNYQNTNNSPAYNWEFVANQGLNNRKQAAANLRADYRLSPRSTVSVNLIYNDVDQPFNKQFLARAFTSQNIAALGANGQPTGTNAILPGFTDLVTRVRGVAASTITLNSISNSTYSFRRAIDAGAEHKFGRLSLDYRAAYSRTRGIEGGRESGQMPMDITGVGWSLDRSQSTHRPIFTQTEGRSIADLNNYGLRFLNLPSGDRLNEVASAVAHARYDLPFSFPLQLKSGFDWRRQSADAAVFDRRYTYLGSRANFPLDPTFELSGTVRAGRTLPYFDATGFVSDGKLRNPELWQEDLYFGATEKYTGTQSVAEEVTAGYGMFQGRLGRANFLGGVRVERTEVEGHGWVRSRTLSTTAQRTTDPVGAAERDYAANRRHIVGDYTDAFPSLHVGYDLTRNLKARLSWSASFGRPAFSRLVPAETPNETQEFLTISNPALKPQYSKNWDAALEYYFEPAGVVSVGWFRKNITDYIVGNIDGGVIGPGPDNGYDGQYEGFAIRTAGNAGSAQIEGWEFNYQQQFTFLPGFLKGIGASFNWTELKTRGDYGGTGIRDTSQVANFVPRTVNANLTYRYRKFNVRVLMSYTSEYLGTASTTAGQNEYRFSRTTYNAGIGYQLHPRARLFIDANNLFNELISRYKHIPVRMSLLSYGGTTVNCGVSGRF